MANHAIRGDIVMRDGLSFVVWTTFDDFATAYKLLPDCEVDTSREVRLNLSGLTVSGRVYDWQIELVKIDLSDLSRQRKLSPNHNWGGVALIEPDTTFADGRYHAPVYESEGGYWVQPTHSEY